MAGCIGGRQRRKRSKERIYNKTDTLMKWQNFLLWVNSKFNAILQRVLRNQSSNQSIDSSTRMRIRIWARLRRRRRRRRTAGEAEDTRRQDSPWVNPLPVSTYRLRWQCHWQGLWQVHDDSDNLGRCSMSRSQPASREYYLFHKYIYAFKNFSITPLKINWF